jgi:RNA polymerase sigma-70 factor (ECF subfamily)
LRSINTKTEREIQIDISNVYNVGIQSTRPELLDVRENLYKIDNKYQIVLDALFFQGMTQQEASEELDIPLGTIKSRLKIGLRELKKIYGNAMSLVL